MYLANGAGNKVHPEYVLRMRVYEPAVKVAQADVSSALLSLHLHQQIFFKQRSEINFAGAYVCEKVIPGQYLQINTKPPSGICHLPAGF